VHAASPSLGETDWQAIVLLYDRLMVIAPSPVVGLNRAVALSQRDGPERGIAELVAIADRDRLETYPFYSAALGELEVRRGNADRARAHFTTAIGLSRNAPERRFLKKRLADIAAVSSPRELGP